MITCDFWFTGVEFAKVLGYKYVSDVVEDQVLLKIQNEFSFFFRSFKAGDTLNLYVIELYTAWICETRIVQVHMQVKSETRKGLSRMGLF